LSEGNGLATLENALKLIAQLDPYPNSTKEEEPPNERSWNEWFNAGSMRAPSGSIRQMAGRGLKKVEVRRFPAASLPATLLRVQSLSGTPRCHHPEGLALSMDPKMTAFPTAHSYRGLTEAE